MSEEPQVRFLGDVERLALEPRDILVIKVPEHISMETMERIKQAVADVAGQERKVLVLSGGMELGVLAPQEA